MMIQKKDSTHTVSILDIKTKEIVEKLKFYGKDITNITFERKSGYLCVTDSKYRLRIYDIYSGELLRYYDQNHNYHAQYARLLDSAKYLLLINDKWEYLIDLKTEEIVKKHYISSVSADFKASVSPDKNTVIRWSNNNSTIYINNFNDEFFDTISLKFATTLIGLAFIDNSNLIVATKDSLYKISISDQANITSSIRCGISYVDFSTITNSYFFISSNLGVSKYDVNLNYLSEIEFCSNIEKMQFTFNGSNLITTEGSIYCYDVSTGLKTKIEGYNYNRLPGKNSNYFFKDSTVYICDNDTGDTLEVHYMPVKSRYFSFSPDMRFCQTSNSFMGPAQIWDWKTKELIYTNQNAWGYEFSAKSKYIIGFEGPTDTPFAYVRILPSGDIKFDFSKIRLTNLSTTSEEEFIYISNDTAINKYRIEDAAIVQSIKFDSLAISSLWKLTWDGKYLLTSHKNGLVKLFRTADHSLIEEFYCWDEMPVEIVLSRDLKHMAVTYYDGSLAVWELPDIVSVSPAEKGSAGPATAEIFPNPSSGEFTIAAVGGFAGEASILVCDLTGREVFRGKVLIVNSQATLNLAEIAPGPYILKIHGSQGIAAMPLMIIK